MLQRYSILLLLLFFAQHARAQQTDPAIFCGADEYVQRRVEADSAYRAFVLKTRLTPSDKADNTTIYTIPVIFVVYHTGEAAGTGSNVSDADLQAQIDLINRRYTGTAPFTSPDTRIRFALAQRSLTCGSFGGIVRFNASSVPNYASQGITSYEAADALAKSFPDFRSSSYNDYIVVRVVRALTFASGFAQLNGGTIFVNANGMKDRSNGNYLLSHEVGHVLSLFHTFDGSDSSNGNGCPANTNPQTDGDAVADTDPHRLGDFGNCNPNQLNSCTNAIFGPLTYNTMNYSCGDRFSNGQVGRMRSFIETSLPSLANNIYLTPPTPGEALTPASCTVGVGLTSNQGWQEGIQQVRFGSINRTSGYSSYYDGYYQDFSCSDKTTVTAGQSYTLSIGAPYVYGYRQVYIDYNNDGTFNETNERVVNATPFGGTSVHTISIPTTAITETYLRLRAVVDEGSTPPTACYLPGNATYGAGQVEDYGVMIRSATPPCTVFTSIKAGSWTDPTVWSCGRIPTDSDAVMISHALTVPASQLVRAQRVVFMAGGRVVYGAAGRLVLGQ